jgi:hypothetical protein
VNRFEHPADAGELLGRLTALIPAFHDVPRLAPPAAAVQGSATMVPDPDAPAAGGGRRAAA